MPRHSSVFVLCVLFVVLTPKVLLWIESVSHGSCSNNDDEGSCCGSSFKDGLYHSTDFEVHRNWLAITAERRFDWLRNNTTVTSPLPSLSLNSAPLLPSRIDAMRYWYREDTSLWTLDYPPLFAYFEFLLAALLNATTPVDVKSWFFGHDCRDLADESTSIGLIRARFSQSEGGSKPLKNIAQPMHVSRGIVAYQRTTVLLFSDVPFVITALLIVVGGARGRCWSWKQGLTVGALLATPGWIIVDNIHFQYNGLIFATFLLSALCAYRDQPILSGLLYFVLVFEKHMMAYFALGYAVWGVAVVLLAAKRHGSVHAVTTLLSFVVVFLVVAVVAVGPFIFSEYRYLKVQPHEVGSAPAAHFSSAVAGALTPMKNRLFPFGRGLCHAYWAPNVYSVYSAADLVLCKVKSRIPSAFVPYTAHRWCGNTSVNTRGLVGLEPTTTHALGDGTSELSPPTHAFLVPVTPMGSNIAVVVAFSTFLLVAAFHSKERCFSQLEWWASANGLMFAAFWSAASFFLFSWHVHEKAILNLYLPILAAALWGLHGEEDNKPQRKKKQQRSSPSSNNDGALKWCLRMTFLLTPTLFPLLFTPKENIIKYGLYVCFGVLPCLLHSDTLSVRHWLMGSTLVASSLIVDVVGSGVFAPLMLHSCLGFIVVADVLLSTLFHNPCHQETVGGGTKLD